MPDWSYRTVLRPLLFRLPPAAARDWSLAAMGALARAPLGPTLIDFLGHMRPPESLRRQHAGLTFPSVVGLGGDLDPEMRATGALARFGVGFLEVGPVTLQPRTSPASIERSAERGSILTPDPPDNPGLAALVGRLGRWPKPGVPLIARLAAAPGMDPGRAADECRQIVEALAPFVDAFGVPAEQVRSVVEGVGHSVAPRAVLACVPLAAGLEEAERLALAALAAGADGLVVDGALRPSPGRRELGLPAREPALAMVARLRQRSPGALLVGSGGVHEPEDALRLLEAGADLVTVDSGLVFSGPGLPKRINEAVIFAAGGPRAAEEASPTPPTELSWFWTSLMGAAMLLGSVMALAIASTRVVLPYDEQFAGMTREQIAAINDRLLAFMAHDRVTLAGTMVTIGVLYTSLSLFGIRRGQHWARVAVLSSALVGFASFFLFLGFGYFDPFHAFVTAILFQLFLLGLHCPMEEAPGPALPVLRDDGRWLRGQWGQLGLIVEAVGFIGAGLVISGVGVTQVFVAEDLEFMGTTREVLVAAGPRLIPLVAHDRATFGGMLLVSGMTFLLSSLWGFGRGVRWLWWTLLVAGLSGYGATLGIHYAVGYHSPWHLAPAVAGLVLFLTAMALSYPHLCGRDAALEEAWRGHRERWAARAR